MRFEDCICVGLIGSPHGVKGYVKVKHFTESPRGVTAYGEVFNYKMEKIILDFKGLSKNLGIYSIKGITNRDLAESFRGIKLFVKKNNLPSLTNGDVYHFDIIGLTRYHRQELSHNYYQFWIVVLLQLLQHMLHFHMPQFVLLLFPILSFLFWT